MQNLIKKVEINVQKFSCVLTVPANAGSPQKHLTRRCAEVAGWEVLAVVNEPTAAALASKEVRNGISIVYDLGGGTFDLSVFYNQNGQYDEIFCEGDANLGGINFMESIANQMGIKTFENFADRADFEQNVISQMSRMDRDGLVMRDRRMKKRTSRLSSEIVIYLKDKFFKQIGSHVIKTIQFLKESDCYLNEEIGKELHFILVGGASMIPGTKTALRKMVKDVLGEHKIKLKFYAPKLEGVEKDKRHANQKKHLGIVAAGACQYGASLLNWTKSHCSELRVPQDIGFVVNDQNELRLKPVLKKSIVLGKWHKVDRRMGCNHERKAVLFEGLEEEVIHKHSDHVRLGEITLPKGDSFIPEMYLDHRQVLNIRFNGGPSLCFNPQLNCKVEWEEIPQSVADFTKRLDKHKWMENVSVNKCSIEKVSKKALDLIEKTIKQKIKTEVKGVHHKYNVVKLSDNIRMMIMKLKEEWGVHICEHNNDSYERILLGKKELNYVGIPLLEVLAIRKFINKKY